jgi:hypothetical protein
LERYFFLKRNETERKKFRNGTKTNLQGRETKRKVCETERIETEKIITFHKPCFFVKLLVVDVKLHDLPPQMTKSGILQKMREYGEILSFTEESWGEGY